MRRRCTTPQQCIGENALTRKLPITARQVTAICKGAGKAGYIPEIILDGVVVRLVPEALSQSAQYEENDEPYVPWPGPRLNYREEQVLRTIVAARDHTLPASTIPQAGPATVNALIAHGLVEIEGGAKVFDRSQNIRASNDGISFFSRFEAHNRKHFCL